MSIFSALKNAIFGSASQASPGPATTGAAQASAATTAAPQASGAAPAQAGSMGGPASGTSPGIQVDIDAVLSAKAAQKGEKLNWRSSIVDLMKLVDLDPSLENRKSLASELGYSGDTKDTATMNVWLHKQVMVELAAAGGKVPEDLRH